MEEWKGEWKNGGLVKGLKEIEVGGARVAEMLVEERKDEWTNGRVGNRKG